MHYTEILINNLNILIWNIKIDNSIYLYFSYNSTFRDKVTLIIQKGVLLASLPLVIARF